jgi:hypothetical protein
MYEPENTNHEISNNGSCVKIVSIVTRLRVVILSSPGSIPSKGIPYKYGMKPSESTIQWVNYKGKFKGKVCPTIGEKRPDWK